MTIDARQYRIGVLYVAASAVAWSSSGLFIRLISTDLMTTLFFRGLVSGTAVFALFFFLEGRKGWGIIRSMGWPAFWAAVFSTASMITGIGSMYYAAIADSMVIYATGPFVTAFVAYFAIGERPSRATMVASAIAFAGVLVMLADKGGSGSLFGSFLAILMTLTAAGMIVVMRKHSDVPMLPAMGMSAWLCSLSTVWFASPMTLDMHNAGLILAFGIVQNALGLSLYTFGAKRIPAADASLVVSLEVPLTPLYVWLALGEAPTGATLIGGPVVLAALFGHMMWEMRKGHGRQTLTASADRH